MKNALAKLFLLVSVLLSTPSTAFAAITIPEIGTRANAMAANGGNKVGLYSPTTWNGGSSGSHLDTQFPAYSSMMMTHSIAKGIEKRSYSNIEVGIMTDLGYAQVTAVPEPQSYALMLAGLGLIGFLRARRQR